MNKTIRILSTKKLLPNQKQFLLNAGFSLVEADFIGIRNIRPKLQEINKNLIFTSRNAVRSILENEDLYKLKGKSCFCVGTKTRSLLEANDFKVVATADNAAELSDKIKTGFKEETFTFLSGNIRLETLPMNLKIAGIAFNEIEVYETAATPKPIKAVLDGILFFSPSAAESYLHENDINSETCFCIGKTTAKALEQITNNIIIANKPSVENVIIQCINHFKTLNEA
ncbi:MAG TPA: uroporphyrinogen-III synthase [Flavobacterium sp.]|jgi:uroporphyrinogen-III synthase